MKNKIYISKFILIFLFSKLTFANTASSTGQAPAAAPPLAINAQGVNEGLNNVKNNNNSGVGSSLGAMAEHFSAAAGLYAAYSASCSTGCKGAILAAAIAQMISGNKAGKQAGVHGLSNTNLMPTLCSTSSSGKASQCSYPNFGECKSTDIQCITAKSKQIPDLKIPEEVTKSLDLPKEACKGNATCLASIPDENGNFMVNGKKMNVDSIGSAGDMKNALGLTEAQVAAQAAADEAAAQKAKQMAIVSFGSSKGGDDFIDSSASAPQTLGTTSGVTARGPANLAGLNKKFRGESIGVALDDIFQMMNRRYKLKDEQNSFMDPALSRP